MDKSKVQRKPIKKKENENLNFNCNFFVCVRVRPLTAQEQKNSKGEIIKVLNNNTISILDFPENLNEEQKKNSKEKVFTFDYAFDAKSTQQQIYEVSTKKQLNSVIEGYNLTIFAYGATGAGKTFTMLGNGDNPGIMPRSIIDLFEIIDKKENHDFLIKISYIEVYNETLRDLISNSVENLELRESPNLGTTVAGAKEIVVTQTNEVFSYLMKGNSNRTTESTGVNEESSRSHALLNIIVENKDKNSKLKASIGRFILVDLAGSERASQTNNTGLRMVESGNINKSLLALGNVINSLVDQTEKKATVFIPWRDSKLTRILKDSIGGNAKIVMIANITPAVNSLDETLNTLKYASRAKNIKTNIKKNIIENSLNIAYYDGIVEGLKNEIESLRHQLAVKTHNQLMNKKAENYVKEVPKQEKLQGEIANHFQIEVKICREIIDEEKKIEKMKNELQEKEYELYQFEKMKVHKPGKLQQIAHISKLKTEIDVLIQQVEEKYYYFNNEIKLKREDLKSQITKLMAKDQVLGQNLNLQYQYQIVLVDNLTLEHKKRNNINLMKKKDVQINRLISQIKYRDEMIERTKSELQKKKIEVGSSVKIKKLDELNIDQSVILPIIVSKEKNIDIPLKNNSSSNFFHKNQNFLPQINGLKQNDKFVQARAQSPKINFEQYSNPLINKPLKTFKTKTNNVIELLKNNQLSNLRLNILNSNYANSKLNFVNPDKKLKHTRNSLDREKHMNRINLSMDNSTDHSNPNFSILDREIEKKAKNILRKNIIGRYKNSPYV